MSPILKNVHPGWPIQPRFAVLTLCAAGAFLCAWNQRERPEVKGEAQPAAHTISEMMKALPPALPGSAAAALRTKALSRAEAFPADAQSWILTGDALAQEFRDTADQQLADHAKSAYQHALSLKPEAVAALTGMAWATGSSHEFSDSLEWAHKALKIDAACPDAWGIAGDAYLELGQYDSALESYQKMMDARPDLSSWSRGAYLLWITGDKSKAMWLMERAIRAGAPFAENTAWCRARLAMMLFHDGALQPANQVLVPALSNGSSNTAVLLAAGAIAAGQGNPDAAIEYYQRILTLRPNQDALAAIGDLHAAKGDLNKAEEYYRQVEELHAKHKEDGTHSHMAMARFFADHDRNTVEAVRLAEQAKLTENVLELDVLAWAYFKSGDLAKAVPAMKRALRMNTPDASMRYHAGMIAAAAGDKVSARRHLQAALSFNPVFCPLQAPRARARLASLDQPENASLK